MISKMTFSSTKLLYNFMPIIIGMITPSTLLFFVQISIGDYQIFQAVQDICHKQFASGYNYLLLTVIGLFPFVILSIILSRRIENKELINTDDWIFCLVGIFGILILMIPSHLIVWVPIYRATRASSTSVIAFFFVPFYSLLSMLITIFIFKKIR